MDFIFFSKVNDKNLDELIKENAPTLSYKELYQANLDRSHTANFLPYFTMLLKNFGNSTYSIKNKSQIYI